MIFKSIASWFKRRLSKKRNVSANKVASATTVVAVRFENGVILGTDGRLLSSAYGLPIRSDCEKIVQIGDYTAIGCSGDSVFIDKLNLVLAQDLRAKNLSVSGVVKELRDRIKDHYEENTTEIAVIVVGFEDNKWPIIKLETCKDYPYVKETRIAEDVRFATVGSGRKYAKSFLTKKKLGEYPPSTTDVDRKREIVFKALKTAVIKDWGSGGRLQLLSIDEKGSDFKNFIQKGASGCCVSEYILDRRPTN